MAERGGFEPPVLHRRIYTNTPEKTLEFPRHGIPVVLGHDLSRVLTAWDKLPPPLKAAILAIVDAGIKKEGR